MIRTILAAVDDTSRAADVLRVALEVAGRFDAKVHLFRVVHKEQEFPPAAATHPDGLDVQAEGQARGALEKLAEGQPRVTVEPVFSSSQPPWHAISEKAAAVDADLIVIGSHPYGGWDRVLPTTTVQLMNHTDRHVLVVRQRAG